jgi:hypothetical protein
MQQCIIIFISYLYEAQHVSGDTPPIIRSLKLQLQPLVFHTLRVVGRLVAGHCQVDYSLPDSVRFQQPHTYQNQRIASAILGS